eukprot:TRINITY_DN8100_c0_g1_i1.p1 TRINITY_DN8100_c0_g1~~TRINITY_DN8100_c0_g1_i1.p1  ORF type:complete len:238 (-),score=65.35 TRINITY_DN8100_c0_g1_i1:66-749(-)
MTESFWAQKWESTPGWYRDNPNARWKSSYEQLKTVFPDFVQSGSDSELAGRKVLIPLCGDTEAIDFFLSLGAQVVGVEFVQTAIDKLLARLEQRFQLQFNKEEEGDKKRYISNDKRVSIYQFDFFQLQETDVDIVFDKAAMVAITPDRRPEYSQIISTCLKKNGAILLETVDREEGGPPFNITSSEIKSRWYLEPKFELLFETVLYKAEPEKALLWGASLYILRKKD